MFKKIRSNRDPQHTIFTELRNEFGAYYRIEAIRFRIFMRRYPKQVFICMLFLITLSLVLSFTLLADKNFPTKAKIPVTASKLAPIHPVNIESNNSQVDKSFNSVLKLGADLKETYRIKKEIDSIIARPSLTKKDSVMLEILLEKLQNINQSLNQ